MESVSPTPAVNPASANLLATDTSRNMILTKDSSHKEPTPTSEGSAGEPGSRSSSKDVKSVQMRNNDDSSRKSGHSTRKRKPPRRFIESATKNTKKNGESSCSDGLTRTSTEVEMSAKKKRQREYMHPRSREMKRGLYATSKTIKDEYFREYWREWEEQGRPLELVWNDSAARGRAQREKRAWLERVEKSMNLKDFTQRLLELEESILPVYHTELWRGKAKAIQAWKLGLCSGRTRFQWLDFGHRIRRFSEWQEFKQVFDFFACKERGQDVNAQAWLQRHKCDENSSDEDCPKSKEKSMLVLNDKKKKKKKRKLKRKVAPLQVSSKADSQNNSELHGKGNKKHPKVQIKRSQKKTRTNGKSSKKCPISKSSTKSQNNNAKKTLGGKKLVTSKNAPTQADPRSRTDFAQEKQIVRGATRVLWKCKICNYSNLLRDSRCYNCQKPGDGERRDITSDSIITNFRAIGAKRKDSATRREDDEVDQEPTKRVKPITLSSIQYLKIPYTSQQFRQRDFPKSRNSMPNSPFKGKEPHGEVPRTCFASNNFSSPSRFQHHADLQPQNSPPPRYSESPPHFPVNQYHMFFAKQRHSRVWPCVSNQPYESSRDSFDDPSSPPPPYDY